MIDAEHNTGIAKIGELHSKAEPVRGSPALPDDRNIGGAQSVAPNQVVSVVRQSQ
jgi:hypothetical protein